MFTFFSQSEWETCKKPFPDRVKPTLKSAAEYACFHCALVPCPPNSVKREEYFVDLTTNKIVRTIAWKSKEDLMRKLFLFAQSFTQDHHAQF